MAGAWSEDAWAPDAWAPEVWFEGAPTVPVAAATATGGLNSINVDVGSRAYAQALAAIAYNPNPGFLFDSEGAALYDSNNDALQAEE